jgi:hypothetical protein
MKLIPSLFLALVLIACSTSGIKETTATDSTASLNDTLDVAALPDEESNALAETEIVMGDTSQLEITFDETAGLVFERQEPFYTVSIVTKQYEASSDVTWYFDTDLAPIYFKETAASEGTEGSVEYFIEDGDVKCALVEESYGDGGSTEKWCSTTGGTMTRSNAETSELLPAGTGTNYNSNLKRYLDILQAILGEAEISDQDENGYTLVIKRTTEIGGIEVEESTLVTIPRKVYEAMKYVASCRLLVSSTGNQEESRCRISYPVIFYFMPIDFK